MYGAVVSAAKTCEKVISGSGKFITAAAILASVCVRDKDFEEETDTVSDSLKLFVLINGTGNRDLEDTEEFTLFSLSIFGNFDKIVDDRFAVEAINFDIVLVFDLILLSRSESDVFRLALDMWERESVDFEYFLLFVPSSISLEPESSPFASAFNAPFFDTKISGYLPFLIFCVLSLSA